MTQKKPSCSLPFERDRVGDSQDRLSGKLFNQWINEHDAGHPAGCNPLLILDVFEHAFMIDYGLKGADYIGAFFKNIRWEAVEGRMK